MFPAHRQVWSRRGITTKNDLFHFIGGVLVGNFSFRNRVGFGEKKDNRALSFCGFAVANVA